MEKCRLFKERKSIPLIGHATRVVLYCNSMISLKLHWAITTLTKSFNAKTGPTSSFTALEMAISFLWALYLKASLILLATLHKSDGSLAANGANVCSRSQRYSFKKTLILFPEQKKTKCMISSLSLRLFFNTRLNPLFCYIPHCILSLVWMHNKCGMGEVNFLFLQFVNCVYC